jgi:ribosome biogenesis GTPase A
MSSAYESQLERAVQWYPGHMVSAMRRMRASLQLVDAVIETVDARVPRSGRNSTLARLAPHKQRIVVLTRSDLADPAITRGWLGTFAKRGLTAVAVDARNLGSTSRVSALLARQRRKGIVRAMILGIPNSGKSSVANSLLKRSAAKTENRAGVTRRAQWFRLSAHLEIMDTPGLLPPKLGSPRTQWKLAVTGAVPSERFDPEEVVYAFAAWARDRNIPVPTLDEFAASRGFMRRGGKVDEHNAAQSYLRAFNDGKLGRITLETPDDEAAA